MSRPARLLADENVSLKLVRLLVQRGLDVKHMAKGLKNSELYSIAVNEGRVLITHDSDFTDTRLYPPLTGTIILDIHPPVSSRIEKALLSLLDQVSENEIKGGVFIVRETGFEVKR